jgi:hypothetical protein
MPSVGFESVIPASKWLQTYALDCMVNGIGNFTLPTILLFCYLFKPHILYFFLQFLYVSVVTSSFFLEINVFWDVIPYRPVNSYRPFRGL